VPGFSLHTDSFLAAPRDLVWRQLVDRESVSAWFDGIERLTGVGERFATRRATEPCSSPVEGRVLELERERRLRLVLSAPWHLLREIELEIELTPDDYGTRVELSAAYRLRLLGWVVRPLVRLRAEIALRRASRGFRAAIEDEVARRRRRRADRPGEGAAELAQSPLAHDSLLLRTASS